MAFDIPILKNIVCVKDIDKEEDYIELDDIVSFLKRHHLPTDFIKEIKKSNVQKEFKGHHNGLSIIDGKLVVSITSFFRYFFNHFDHLAICRQVVLQISKRITTKEASSGVQTNIHQLYTSIAKHDFKNNEISSILHKFAEDYFDISSIPTLYADYRTKFSKEEWLKIIVFEYHFSKQTESPESLSYEEDLNKKWMYFKELQESEALSKSINKVSTNTINSRLKRRNVADMEYDVQLHVGNVLHLPTIMEDDILNVIGENAISIVVDCEGCTHNTGVHVYLEMNTAIQPFNFEELVQLIVSSLQRRHNVDCREIILFSPGSFTPFMQEEQAARFHLRDQIILHRLDDHIIHRYEQNPTQLFHSSFDETTRCPKCFGENLPQPLHWKSFQWIKEWLLDVPLQVQIMLESFINKRSLKRSENLEKTVQDKITKLYTIYDSLLNLKNKKYCGVIQEMNTQELAMNYHSVGTVFAVASTSGASLSLSSAEKRIKERADSDLCYYNTYIRKYPMEYKTLAGPTKKNVSLRDCTLILMMDNLVRLKYHADPNPGESRSMQICTLPITVAGVPLDAIELEDWHDTELCNGENQCSCKTNRILKKEDLDKLLLNLLPAEENCKERFQRMCFWGFPKLWQQLEREELWSDVVKEGGRKQQQADTSLEDSFALMTVEEGEEKAEDLSTEAPHESSLDAEVATDESTETEADDEEHLEDILEKTEADEEEHLEDILENFDEVELSEIHSDMDEIEKYFTPLENNESFERIQERTDQSPDAWHVDSDITFDDSEDGLLLAIFDELTPDEMAAEFGFHQYKPPTLLVRHPPPATGRDDDIMKLREVLDDILLKSGSITSKSTKNKILFGPDNKIGKNLLELVNSSKKYSNFLPEFPVLHLRKSKINNICSAYKNAGIIHILKYMRDEDHQEWKKLITADHIDKASRFIRRLSLALHMSFQLRFLQTLSSGEASMMLKDMQATKPNNSKWEERFSDFLNDGKTNNATFLLHYELMQHCDEVSAITLAERQGGTDGYNLLMAAVKSSLPFSFLNGASSYAAYCTQLIHEHCKSGIFYQNLKASLYTTPHKESDINFGLDSQREIDHKDVLKSFRSGSTMSSIVPRMALIDTLNEAHEKGQKTLSYQDANSMKHSGNKLGLQITDTDVAYILRVVGLILRQDGLSLTRDSTVYNVYAKSRLLVSSSILDANTLEIGKFLIQKYASNSGIFGCDKQDMPDIKSVNGPKDLLKKLKSSKGITIKRLPAKQSKVTKSERDIKEEARVKSVKHQINKIDRMSSEMNACQAVVKPDCSKPKVQKSSGIQKALSQLLMDYINQTSNGEDLTKFMMLSTTTIPEPMKSTTTCATIEFAGVKFQTKAIEGMEYLKFAQNSIIKNTFSKMPNIKHLAICEEKYSFTPDDFKAATRSQRQKSASTNIAHLKTSSEILSLTKFDKTTLITTAEGKSLISTYLAKNISLLNVEKDVVIDMDSELHVSSCICGSVPCLCKYTTPIRSTFTSSGFQHQTKLEHIQQCKGEAEMAQLDWLMEYKQYLQEGEACASIVTSGDIDAVVLHLFMLSHMWDRTENGTFRNPVYVVLKKRKGERDIYNITAIIEFLEKVLNEKYVAMKVAMGLSLGGNDYLPRFFGISHNIFLKTMFTDEMFRSNLIQIYIGQAHETTITFNSQTYQELIKALYCPKRLDYSKLTFDEVRQLSVKTPSLHTEEGGKIKDPQKWMPPRSSVEKLGLNIKCLIQYYLTAGRHSAPLPNFIEDGCLVKTSTGEVEYDLGHDAHIKDINELTKSPSDVLLKRMNEASKKGSKKRKLADTPQKGHRRKSRPVASTPRALFPCGDSMVCIIDDREDVWNFAPNLVHVKPYRFFQGTADINAPAGLAKTENDDQPITHRVRKVSRSDSIKENSDETKDSKSDSVDAETNLTKDAQNNNENKQDQSEPQIQPNIDQSHENTGSQSEPKIDNITDQSDEVSENKAESNIEKVSQNSKSIDSRNDQPESRSECISNLSVENEIEQCEGSKSSQSESKSEDLSNQINETKSEMHDVDSSKVSGCLSDKNTKGQLQSSEFNETAGKKVESKQKDEKETEDDIEEIEWEDEDDYLFHLEEILTRIHRAFYDLDDQMKSRAEMTAIEKPDLKNIIPYVKRKVLKGTNIVFSGVFPTNMPAEKSRAYIVAKSLGANVQNVFVPQTDNKPEEATTHLIAAQPGTAKVNLARKAKNVKIVNPDWLWCCAERWEKVEEKIFPLTKDSSSARNSPVIVQNRSKPEKRKSDEMEEVFYDHITGKRVKRNDDSSQCESDINVSSTSQKLTSENDAKGLNNGEPSKQRESRFSVSYNPLFSFSDDDIACMDKEVEEIMDEDGEESDEDEEERDSRIRSVVLSSSSADDGSSSDDSMSGDTPRGWNSKKRKTRSHGSHESSSDHEEKEGGELPEESENELDNFEKTVDAFAPDTESDGESIGSVDDELADAVEKEFLAQF